MDQKTKKIIIIAVAITIIAIIIMSIIGGKNKKDNNNSADTTPPNTSEKLNETKGFEGLSFSNIKFEVGNGGTELRATVTNTTQSKIGDRYIFIRIDMLDKNGEVIAKVTAQIDALEAGESTTLGTVISGEYENIYDIQFKELEQ